MSVFNIYNANLIDQSTITASTENAVYPVSNIQDHRRTKVYRSTANTANVVIDFGETSDIDTIFVLAEKRNGFGFNTITFEFNGTSDFTTPAFSQVVTVSEVHSLGHAEFTQISYRFCRIVMTSTLGYCELAKVFIGTAATINRGINFGWSLKDEELSQKSFNRYGQQFTDVITRQKKISFAFSYLDKDNLQLLNNILDYHGETKPIWFKIGDVSMSDDYRRTSGAFLLEDVPQVSNTHFNKYNMALTFKELT